MAIGSLTVPVLMNSLTRTLSAQTQPNQQSIIWLKGQSSENQSSGVWSLPEFPDFLDRYFHTIPVDQINVDSFLVDYSDRGPFHLLILEGYFTNDPDDELHNLLKDLIVVSRAVILLGNEASYGRNVPSGFMNLETELLYHVETPYIKLPGAPVHIRHLLGTLNHLILFDLPRLDEYRRPTMFYSWIICEKCEYRIDFEAGRFATRFGEREGCLYLLGCKGPVTRNSCPVEKWNGTTTWCVGCGSPCAGCSEPDYPDNQGLGIYGQLSKVDATVNSGVIRHADIIAKGAIGVTLGGIVLHTISKRTSTPLKKHQINTLNDDE